MAHEAPLVSVIIPTYNRAGFVTKAVDSVLCQTFTDYELIVVDDGSTDATKERLEQYADQIIYIYQNNSGVSAARNAGITIARGEWLAFLDSDDEWRSDYLATQIRRANTIPGLCMQSANCLLTYHNEAKPKTYFELNGAIAAFKGKDYLLIDEPFAFVVAHGPWQLGSTIVRRDATTKTGSFDTTLTYHEDFDFMVRVSLHGRFGMIKEEFVNIYRRDEPTECLTNQIRKDPLRARRSHERIYQKLQLIETLHYRERKALNRVMSDNRRAIGNLVLQTGNIKGARGWYRSALLIDPSIRSVSKFILSYFLPPGALASTSIH